MPTFPPVCPAWDSTHTVKNGFLHNGKQNFKCREGWRRSASGFPPLQFDLDPHNKIIDKATKALIDKLLLEKIPLAEIARVVSVSEPWLQNYVKAKYRNVPPQTQVQTKKRGA